MGDAISTAIGLGQNLYQLAKYLEDVKNSGEERGQWLRTTNGLIELLNILKDHAKTAYTHAADPWYQGFLKAIGDGASLEKNGSWKPGGALRQLNGQVELLLKELEKKGFRELMSRVAHTWKKEEIENVFKEITKLESRLNTFLAYDHFALSRAIHDSLKVQDNRQREKEEAKVVKWLSLLEFLRRHQEINEECFAAGKWLLDSVEFHEWLNGSTWPLHCRGNPGAGKTVLASIIIEHLRKYCKDAAVNKTKRAAVLFLYLDHSATKIQTLRNLVGSLLKQLMQNRETHEPLPRSVTELWEDCKGETQPSVDKYLKVLKKVILDSYDRVYIVVDALDEFPEDTRGSLLTTLIKRIFPERVSVLLTTRDISERHDELRIICNVCGSGAKDPRLLLYYRCKKCNHDICQPCKNNGEGCRKCGSSSQTLTAPNSVIIDIRSPDDEIERFVKWDLERVLGEGSDREGDERLGGGRIEGARLGGFCQRRPQLIVDIPIRIREQAKGMFLLAKLHLDTLKAKRTVKEVKKALDHLSDLDSVAKIYEGILLRIEGQHDKDDARLAKTALLWVVSARRSLTVRELLHALAIEDCEGTIDEDDLTDWKTIQKVTLGLIVKGVGIEDVDRADPQTAVVSFAHRTAQDFFTRNRARLYSDTPSAEISSILTYLSFPHLAKPCQGIKEDAEINERLKDFPFLAYACQYWGDHALETRDSPEAQKEILQFLQASEKLAATVQAAWYVGSKSKHSASWDVRNGVSSLHICAWYGLDFLIPPLLEGNPEIEIDSLDPFGRTPLMYACKRGDSGTAALLLELHADPTIECDLETSAIVQAALGDHVEIMETLFKIESVDINKAFARNYDYTVLMLATLRKKEAVVKHLLQQRNVDINLKGSKGYSALSLAAATNCKAIIDMLLEQKNLDINATNDNGATALLIAAETGNAEIVKTLLGQGADPALKDCEGDTAMLRAMKKGHCSTVTVMLDSHIDFMGADSRGHSLLHSACLLKEPRPDVVRLFIDKGLDIDAQDTTGQTPLHMASRTGRLEVVQVLVDSNANLNIKDGYGRTPLNVAWQQGSADIVQILANRASEAILDDVALPLWALARLGRQDLIQRAVQSKKFDIEERDPDTGRSALHWATESVVPSVAPTIITLLIDAGFSISATDAKGMTPLHITAYIDNIDCMEILLKSLPPLEQRDEYGRTALAAAQFRGYDDLAIVLLESGALATNGIKEKLEATFFMAVQLGRVKAVEVLIEAGVNVQARNEEDQTALQIAKAESRKDVTVILKRALQGESPGG